MKLTFTMIVFNGEYVLRQLLESIYPFAHKIIIVDGVVEYWAKQGFTGSVDNTVKIIKEFPDPDNKIILHEKIVRKEKTELCQVYMQDVPEDTDYIWAIDSDEIYKPEHIELVDNILERQRPESISFSSNTFFGGFAHVLTGYERKFPFKRIMKYKPGATYIEHRPPLLSSEDKNGLHIPPSKMLKKGIEIYHYSYVFPKQVKDKISYYKACISKENCINNYFEKIWLQWVLNPNIRYALEFKYNGIHEFIPSFRGECKTELFRNTHPASIKKSLPELLTYLNLQLDEYR